MQDPFLIRIAQPEDVEETFTLSNQNYVRQYSINRNIIKWEDHVAWFNNIIEDVNNVFYVITDKADMLLGQVRYEINDTSATVSISVAESIRGKGYSEFILLKSMEKLFAEREKVQRIIAYINEENLASIGLFERNGFSLISKDDGLLKYIYDRGKRL